MLESMNASVVYPYRKGLWVGLIDEDGAMVISSTVATVETAASLGLMMDEDGVINGTY